MMRLGYGVVTSVRDPRSLGRVRMHIPSELGPSESGWILPLRPGDVVPAVGDRVPVFFARESGRVVVRYIGQGTDRSEIPATVIHGDDEHAARPEGYAMVVWFGSVEPSKMADGDLWADFSDGKSDHYVKSGGTVSKLAVTDHDHDDEYVPLPWLPDPTEEPTGRFLRTGDGVYALSDASTNIDVVVHGDDPDAVRPGTLVVYWIGEVEPNNMQDNDLWLDRSTLVTEMPDGYRFGVPIVFEESGTFVKSDYPRATAFKVQAVGAGGGGAGATATGTDEGSFGDGGGGGEYREGIFLADEMTSPIAVTVGTGGASSVGGTGSSGTASSFGSLMTANGGQGGAIRETTGLATATGSANSGRGGSGGSGGYLSIPGGGGSRGLSVAENFSSVRLRGGAGGPSFLSMSGYQIIGNGSGSAGSGYGGGGDGAANAMNQSARAGGAGADGVVIVTPMYPGDPVAIHNHDTGNVLGGDTASHANAIVVGSGAEAVAPDTVTLGKDDQTVFLPGSGHVEGAFQVDGSAVFGSSVQIESGVHVPHGPVTGTDAPDTYPIGITTSLCTGSAWPSGSAAAMVTTFHHASTRVMQIYTVVSSAQARFQQAIRYGHPDSAVWGPWNLLGAEGWISGLNVFTSEWQAYTGAGSYQEPGYRREGDRVFLKGLVERSASSEAVVAALPVGYRPAGRTMFSCWSSVGAVRVDVATNGQIITNGLGNDAVAYLSLDNISFTVDG